MNITFLGTSSGVPTRQRNVSATAIQSGQERDWLLVDCGEATQHQLLHTRLSPQKLRAILITHVHGDHCYGLPGLLASCQMGGRTDPLILVGPASLRAYLQAVIEHTEMHIAYPLHFIEVSEDIDLELNGFRVRAARLSHRVACWAYRLEESHDQVRLDTERLAAEGVPPSSLYRRLQQGERVVLADGRELEGDDYCIRSRDTRVVVVGGDNDTPELLTHLCRGAQLLIHEATYTEAVLQRVGPEPQHSSAARVARFAQAQHLPALILTHFSPRYRSEARREDDLSMDDLRAEALQHYTGTLYLAEDLATYTLNREGEVLPVG